MLRVCLRKRRGDFSLNVEFQTETPGVTALFGRSGCGKSTTTHLLAGLLRPDEGRIEIDGTVLFDSQRRIDVAAERRRIGYVFQDSRLFPHLDVAGNLRYGQRRAGRRGRTAPAGAIAAAGAGVAAGAGTAAIRFDEVVPLLGLEPLLGRRAGQLSGGERQRVAIGRALLSQPRLLLLDEPLAALDAARREELLPWLERLRDRLSIPMVYVSHQFEEVLRLAGKLVLLESGTVRGCGDVTALSRSPALRAIVGSDSLGAVLQGVTESAGGSSGLARIRLGSGHLDVEGDLQSGQPVRVQLLARDLILALEPPRGLSVRNSLEGTVASLEPDGPRAWLAATDIGGTTVLVRITDEARVAMGLHPGLRVWVLVKAVSLRGHVFAGPGPAQPPVASGPT